MLTSSRSNTVSRLCPCMLGSLQHRPANRDPKHPRTGTRSCCGEVLLTAKAGLGTKCSTACGLGKAQGSRRGGLPSHGGLGTPREQRSVHCPLLQQDSPPPLTAPPFAAPTSLQALKLGLTRSPSFEPPALTTNAVSRTSPTPGTVLAPPGPKSSHAPAPSAGGTSRAR